jgi:signal peptide peptidase SppA
MNNPWAIVPSKLAEIRDIYATHMKGDKIDIKAIRAEAMKEDPYAVEGGVAIIPVQGVLTKTRTFFSYLFGGTSMRDVGIAFQEALDNPAVHSIVLAVDSPGGTVDGTHELAAQILAARGVKPIVTVSDGMMASAAYWIGSAADKSYITGPTVEIGSIGVVATHIDVSEQDRMYGEKYTEITAGKFKRISSAHRPLTEEGRASIQERVDGIYSVFVQSVAENRARSVEQVLEAADGKIYMGQAAVDVGLVDGVATLTEVINQLKEDFSMNRDELKAKHPDIFTAVFEEGKAAGLAEGVESGKKAGFDAGRAEGITEGQKAEQQRIKDVEAALLPGHESLIQAFKDDGKTTGAEAMAAVFAAEKKIREDQAAKLAQDAIKPAAAAPAPAAAEPAADANLPIEDQAKAEWDKNHELRNEFKLGGLSAYVAFLKNAANIRILKK